ncbi:DLH domain-containing protein [Citrus sinensis]|uniref:DLH domain-containing protein n=1 Tax=Citrus sinensis TaxID=2711 RepID=A0ACB8I777_CITSI|nr:DLH domain-containing protein [Citrus sinensis]
MSGSQCFENPPKLSPGSGCGAGTVQQLGGLNTYVTGSGPPDSKSAILLISDVFGYEAPLFRYVIEVASVYISIRDVSPRSVVSGSLDHKCAHILLYVYRKLADKVAGAGFLVVAPDFFYGDPIVDLNNPQFDREAWRKIHNTDKGYVDAKSVIAALKSKGVSAIGAAGFCWGGVVAAKLASSHDIQAAVVLHPGAITVDDINEIKVPVAILGAEIDHISPPEDLKRFGEILSAKLKNDCLVKIYPRVSHGWTVRYNVEDEFAVKSAEEAHEDMINWLTKYVKRDE